MKSPRWLTALLPVLLIILITPAPAYGGEFAQVPGLIVTVDVGFGGVVKEGLWSPVAVTIENDGPDISGELVINDGSYSGGRISTPVDLPHQSRKRFTLYSENFSRLSTAITVELLDENGHTLHEEIGNYSARTRSTYIVGVISDTPGMITALTGIMTPAGKAVVTDFKVTDLPDNPTGWGTLDALAVGDADTSRLTAAQLNALDSWLTDGGHLLMLGTTNPGNMMSGLAEFSPLRVMRTGEVSLNPIAEYTGDDSQVLNGESLAVIGQATADALTLIDGEDGPLVVTREHGGGLVTFFAPDPLLAPFKDWEGKTALWREILAQADSVPAFEYGLRGEAYNAEQAIASIPDVGLPPVLPMLVLLVGYAFAVGPLNILILSRLKKREWAWVTIPVIVVVFTAAAFMVGFSLQGGEVVVHRLSVIHTYPGGESAHVDGLLGVWSPRRRAYDIVLDETAFAERLENAFGNPFGNTIGQLDFVIGGENTIRDEMIDAGSVNAYRITGTMEDPPLVEGDIVVRSESGMLRLHGEVVNYSDQTIRDASVFYLGQAVAIGDIGPGEAVSLNDSLVAFDYNVVRFAQKLAPYPVDSDEYYYMAPELQTILGGEDCDFMWGDGDYRRCNLLAAIFSGPQVDREAYVFGWIDEPAFSVEVRDTAMREESQTMLIAEVRSDFDIQSTEGLTRLDERFVIWEVLDRSPNTYFGGDYGGYLEPGQFITLRFAPVFPLDEPFNAVSFTIDTPGVDAGAFELGALNMNTGNWIPIQLSNIGTANLSNPAFFDDEGGIVLRLENPEHNPYGQDFGEFNVTFYREDAN